MPDETEPDLGSALKIAIFVEGRVHRIASADTRLEAVAFCQGFCVAADKYRANVSLYLLPEDLDVMIKDEDPNEVRTALEEAGIR